MGLRFERTYIDPKPCIPRVKLSKSKWKIKEKVIIIKVQKAVLEDFLRKANLGGDVETALITFDEKGATIISNSNDTNRMCRTNIPAQSFKDYEKLGKIGIRNLNDVQKFVRRFKDKITIKVKDNYIVLTEGGKQVEFAMCDESFVKEAITADLKYDYTAEVDVNTLKDVLNDAKAIANSNIQVSAKENRLMFSVNGSVDKIKTAYNVQAKSKENIMAEFNTKQFGGIIDCLTASKVKLHLREAYPLQITETAGPVTTLFVVTPRVKDEVTDDSLIDDNSENEDENDVEEDVDFE